MKIIMILMLSMIAANANAVSKCKDENGKVSYKTGPCVKSQKQAIDGGNFSSVGSDGAMTKGHITTKSAPVLVKDVRTGKSTTVELTERVYRR